ncbi:cytochrome c553 [Maritalea mobilis]|uniref:Cytochrome c553 n=2 Tax=Maritalea mobilis TaxID=483324 RepID=A0A4R6VMX6_9HYPH|nr:cytochrome c553 [Maritalea mobilis]
MTHCGNLTSANKHWLIDLPPAGTYIFRLEVNQRLNLDFLSGQKNSMNKNVLIISALAFVALMAFIFVQSNTPAPTRAPMVSVTPIEVNGQTALGKAKFDDNCASCHGENATGLEGLGPPLVHKIYEPSHHADIAFMLAARNGVRAHHWPFGNMPAVDIEESDMQAIIAYIRKLQVANGID